MHEYLEAFLRFVTHTYQKAQGDRNRVLEHAIPTIPRKRKTQTKAQDQSPTTVASPMASELPRPAPAVSSEPTQHTQKYQRQGTSGNRRSTAKYHHRLTTCAHHKSVQTQPNVQLPPTTRIEILGDKEQTAPPQLRSILHHDQNETAYSE